MKVKIANNQGGTINVFPAQRDLNLETKETFGTRIEPSIIKLIRVRAKDRGISPSKYAGDIIKKYLEAEDSIIKARQVLEDIIV